MTRGDRTGSALPLVALRGITKRYGELLANDGIDLAIGRGEIHALLGENGAGKSTLVKILYGVVEPTRGRDPLGGPAGRASPRRSRRAASASAWCSSTSRFSTQLTVAENIAVALCRHGLDARRRCAAASARSAAATGSPLEPDRAVWTPLGRRAAAHRDRPLPAAGPEAPDPRRADLGADPAGGRAPVRDPRAARRPRAARSSTSRTSSRRCAACARPPPSCAHGRVVATLDPRERAPAPSLALMVGSEVGEVTRRTARRRAGRRGARGARPVAAAGRSCTAWP